MPESHDVPIPDSTAEVARRAMKTLQAAEVPFLVSGAHALAAYTDITRQTKDFDICVTASSVTRALDALKHAGFETSIPSDIWLAKAQYRGELIDLIFNSGHAEHPVDETWFDRAPVHSVLDMQVPLVPVEELIRSKAFLMERHRFDGADVAHLLRSCADDLDWDHLVESFEEHWPVLLAHLVLFQYIYPARRELIPDDVLDELTDRLEDERDHPPPEEDTCRGTLLSRYQYLVDLDEWGCTDGRLEPHGTLSQPEAASLSARDNDREA